MENSAIQPKKFDVFKDENIVFENEENDQEDIIMDVYEAPKEEDHGDDSADVNFEANSQDIEI